MDKKIIWHKEFGTSGFANSVYQFIFLKYIEQHFQCHLALGNMECKNESLPWKLFDLPNSEDLIIEARTKPTPILLHLGKHRSHPPHLDKEKVRNSWKMGENDCVVIEGYFQYDTNLIKKDESYYSLFKEYLSLDNKNTTFQKKIGAYKDQFTKIFIDRHLIVIHIRRGDYLDYARATDWRKQVFFTLNIDNAIESINKYLQANRIATPTIYIASDDLPYCQNYFKNQGLNIVTAKDLIATDQSSQIDLLLIDLAAMAASQVFISSNSSFSILGSLLNTEGRIFWRQTNEGIMTSFDPWATPILYGLEDEF